MKNNYIQTLIILILFFTLIDSTFALVKSCNNKNGYNLYECRKNNICKKEYGAVSDNTKQLNPVYITKPYNKTISGNGLDDAKKIYRKNQNNIYKCGILKIQEDSLMLIKLKLLSKDTSGSIKGKINQIITNRINDLKKKMKKIGCIDTNTTTIQNKFNVLNQSTYELCNYNSYLEYLKQYDSDINNVLFPKQNNSLPNTTNNFINNKQYSIKDVSNIMTNIQNNINNEIENSYKVFPLAYSAYSEYENNYTIHVLLNLIREDYIVLRNKLYSVLNPISQFIFKVANAMKMP